MYKNKGKYKLECLENPKSIGIISVSSCSSIGRLYNLLVVVVLYFIFDSDTCRLVFPSFNVAFFFNNLLNMYNF